MKNFRLFSFSFLHSGFVLTSMAQATDPYPSEKVYLHTDRLEYVAGDTLWYKAYIVEAKNHRPQPLSKVLYVSLLDAQGRFLHQHRLWIQSGTSVGQMALPDTLTGKQLQLVAYTRWMQNEPVDFFFRRTLRVWPRKTTPLVSSPAPVANSLQDLQFLPEGGHLVSGLQSRVAFKASDAAGRGCMVAGQIVDDNGEAIIDFESQHLGMGVFSFTPQPGRQYKAFVEIEGQRRSFLLPPALAQGYVMNVDNVIRKSHIQVAISTLYPLGGKLHLFAHIRGKLAFEAYLDGQKPTQVVLIPRDTLRQQGIVHLTLFDASNRPLCERLIFVNPTERPQLSFKTIQPTIQTSDSVHIEMAIDSAGHQIEVADLSVTVVNATQTQPTSEAVADIRSYLLLTSDLKGYVEKPNFYFDQKQKRAPLFLDLLMMTQGWRRFTWQDLLSDSLQKPTHPIEQSLTLTGRILNENNTAFGNMKFRLIFKSPQDIFVHTVSTDKKGAFRIENIDLQGSYEVTAVDERNNLRVGKVIFDSIPVRSDLFVTPQGEWQHEAAANESLILNDLKWQNLLKGWEGGIVLQEVLVKGAKVNPLERDSRRQLYGGKPDRSLIMNDDLASSMASRPVLELVASKIPGLSIARSAEPGADYKVSIRGRSAVMLLDGIQVPPSVIASLNPFELEVVDVLIDQAPVMGVSGGGGAINFLTKRGPSASLSSGKIKPTRVTGYESSRVFFTPNYKANPEVAQLESPPTLYWNPSIKLTNGKAMLNFATANLSAQYIVWIEGLTKAGTPLTGKLIIETKP
ncbi:MAG: TonB-dependent receptor [Runella sp.]